MDDTISVTLDIDRDWIESLFGINNEEDQKIVLKILHDNYDSLCDRVDAAIKNIVLFHGSKKCTQKVD